jgi:hypothetical protein
MKRSCNTIGKRFFSRSRSLRTRASRAGSCLVPSLAIADLATHPKRVVGKEAAARMLPNTKRKERGSGRRAELSCRQSGDSIPDLDVLRCPRSRKKAIVRKSLQSGGLARCQAATLTGIRMDKIVPVLAQMRSHGCCWAISELNAEAIVEKPILNCLADVLVFGQ